MIKEITIQNLLSFGPSKRPLKLRPLNVLVGANGSGKSNLIEVIGLLGKSTAAIADPVNAGGGISHWLWKGAQQPTATIEVVVTCPHVHGNLRHRLRFAANGFQLELSDEAIEAATANIGESEPYFFFKWIRGEATLNIKGTQRGLRREEADPQNSILAQRKDPEQYPELTALGKQYDQIQLYREWSFGRNTVPRLPQNDTGSNRYLRDDFKNLGLVLNQLMGKPDVKRVVLQHLRELYDGITDIHIAIYAGHVEVTLHEGSMTIPATRLSDGTLRYLCLIAILCHPEPPPLVCIEEPELGLHPDAVNAVAKMLKAASLRTQVIVTTHSKLVVDALSESPEDVIICEKVEGQTQMNRLDATDLHDWLEKYSLGELWRSGQIGGNRW